MKPAIVWHRRLHVRLTGAVLLPLALLATALLAAARRQAAVDALEAAQRLQLGLAATIAAQQPRALIGADGRPDRALLADLAMHAMALNPALEVNLLDTEGCVIGPVSVVDAGGLRPVSVTENSGIVAVLNAGGAGNVAGFRNVGGRLVAVAGSVQPLSAAGGTAPAQASFAELGKVLVVTEKATNKLSSYAVASSGAFSAPVVTASAGVTPFGFAVDRRGTVLVSEAFGGAAGASTLSSYVFASPHSAQPTLVSNQVGSGQSAACWVVVTPNSRFAYVTNTASGNISSYAVNAQGRATLSQAVAAVTDAGPIDAAIGRGGRTLFVLNGAARTLQFMAIGRDGVLSHLGRAMDLPPAANGLAAN